jgi:hypothetical protein|tara:strand:+ start:293 stop:430 length:138 start_codon:yes stop_codon:yes gene_type:complete
MDKYDRAVEFMRESALRGAPLFHIRLLVGNTVPTKQLDGLEATAS